jgi:hypothetical protein
MLELAANLQLPETLRFLNPGWFILHLCAIPLVFLIGMAVGRKGAFGQSPVPSGMERTPAGSRP